MRSERWEYKVVTVTPSIWGEFRPDEVTETLNREERDGWELVNSLLYGVVVTLFLKRPL